jgi:cell division FtsZ-interacting protein ZapD
MSELEDKTIAALKTLFDMVDVLQRINIRDILKPEMYARYEKTLQAAYDPLTQVEHTINSLGMKLEYQHWRLGGAMEQLKAFVQ